MESLKSVLPIALIVLSLSITLVPISTGDMFLFIVGVVCLVFGMSLFTAGAEMSMQPLGTKLGTTMASSKKNMDNRLYQLYNRHSRHYFRARPTASCRAGERP